MLKIYKILLLVLASLMPIQTLLVQLLVSRLGLPFWVSLWKEIAVVTLTISTLLFTINKIIRNQNNIPSNLVKITPIGFVLFATLLIMISSYLNNSPLGNFLAGFRFELLWLWFFASVVSAISYLNKKEKTELSKFTNLLTRFILIGFTLVAIISVISLIFGQEKVLEFFGFGESASKYITSAPLSHVIDGGGFNDSIRLSGGFSTPNHFAAYLLLLVGFLFAMNFRKSIKFNITSLILLVIVFIILSFARFSWLGLVLIFSVLGILKMFENRKWPKAFRNICVSITLLIPVFISVIAINLPHEFLASKLPSYLAKPSSTSEHRRHTLTTIDILKEDKSKIFFGYGLGVSGPAAKEEYNDIYKNPLIQKYPYIPYRWGLVERDMLIPENWFLQVLINGGFFYLTIYLAIVLIPLFELVRQLKLSQTNYYKVSILLGMCAVLIGNLVLHIWENQTVAIYWTFMWILLFDKNTQTS